jgi:hypothetical protein
MASAPPAGVAANPPSCAAIVEQAAKNPSDTAIERAVPLALYLPPLPPPPSMDGHTVVLHMHVTELGLVEPSSIIVDSVNNMNYRHQIVVNAGRIRFRPARLAGCWVPSTMEIRYSFGPRR